MQDLTRFALAGNLKWLLLAALAALLLLLVYSGWRNTAASLERRGWTRHPATLVSTRRPPEFE